MIFNKMTQKSLCREIGRGIISTYNVLGQVSTRFFGALIFEFCISENVNKIRVLLSKMRDLQGFRRKKDLADFTLQGQFFYCGFTIRVCPKSHNSVAQLALNCSLGSDYVRQGSLPLPPQFLW